MSSLTPAQESPLPVTAATTNKTGPNQAGDVRAAVEPRKFAQRVNEIDFCWWAPGTETGALPGLQHPWATGPVEAAPSGRARAAL